MAALLPAAVYLVLVLLLLRRGIPLRRALLLGAVGWGVLVVAITESLSVFGTFSTLPVALSWTAVLLVSGGVLTGRRRTGGSVSERGFALRGGLPEAARGVPVPLMAGASVLLGGVLLVAVLGAPNNGDSMSYHLPRVMHWIQNGSVAHYPSWIPRQLYQPPMAEFAVAHFQLLYGSDRLAALVQWFSLVGCGVAVSLVAARLGAGRTGQALAGLFVFTLPMGLLQGMTTQNDLVEALWLVGGVYFCLETFDRPRDNIAWGSVVPLGLCLGLSVLTKGTAYVFLPPLLLAVFMLALYRHGGRGLRIVLFCLVIILIINAGHYGRNLESFGNILMPTDLPFSYRNELFGPDVLLSNVVRNLGLHFGTPFPRINQAMEAGVHQIHTWLGLPVNDPRTTWRYTRFKLHFNVLGDSHAHNPIHLLLIGLSLGGFLLDKGGPYPAREGWLVGGILTGFLLFCAVLQWQPWHSRLHLPLFVLAAAFVGVQVERNWPRSTVVLIALILMFMGMWVVANNRSHPLTATSKNPFLTPRIEQYFSNRPDLKPLYESIVKRLKRSSCRDFGLILGLEDWEYPFWVLLDRSMSRSYRLIHYVPPNLEGKRTWNLADRSADRPCQVVALGTGWADTLREDGWTMTGRFSAVSIWGRSSSVQRSSGSQSGDFPIGDNP